MSDATRGARSHGSGVSRDQVDVIATTLAKVARDLESQWKNAEETLLAIIQAAAHTVPGAEFASITEVRSSQELSERLATSPVAARADAAQYELGEGPCLDSAYAHQTIRVRDFADEPRWPRFAEAALGLGVRSMLALQLYVEQDDLGALNLFARVPHAFDDEAESVGLLFAAHAAVAMAGANREASMRIALSSRDLIGQAKGMLMERYKIDADVAFGLLVRVSQESNIRVAVVAEQLARTGLISP
ncbi:GAF and ANTAR domain-containing protein [Angustibacter luteus]|uniref:GAF and ANTAR domain-containing protein n=1 Tax=Angustibacter luteus TaxID=658456 RepID=A0ABW1JHU3_9ACTN